MEARNRDKREQYMEDKLSDSATTGRRRRDNTGAGRLRSKPCQENRTASCAVKHMESRGAEKHQIFELKHAVLCSPQRQPRTPRRRPTFSHPNAQHRNSTVLQAFAFKPALNPPRPSNLRSTVQEAPALRLSSWLSSSSSSMGPLASSSQSLGLQVVFSLERNVSALSLYLAQRGKKRIPD